MTDKTRKGVLSQRLLRDDIHGNPVSEAVKVAVALLFWEIANVDGDMNGKEHEEILYRLDHNFGLTSGEATDLLEVVLALERGKRHLDSHLGEIDRAFSPQQREHLFQVLLEIATCDGEIESAENDLALIMREKLNLQV